MKKSTQWLIAIVIVTITLFSCDENADGSSNNDSDDDSSSFSAVASISVSPSSVSEGDESVDFTIALDKTNTTSANISIALNISGSATASSDYTQVAESVSIADGESSAKLSFALIDDDEEEDDETIVVSISSEQPDGISVSTAVATVSISDDDGTETIADCPNDNSISRSDIGCPNAALGTSSYSESITDDFRIIDANSVPNHDYGDARNQFEAMSRTYTLDATPTKAAQTTSILSATNRPQYWFGIALNGVIYAPAPATPFIFENTETGEYNWDWVFEPTLNRGSENGQVQLDCSGAHIGPQGYHYHGNMFEYVETIQTGLSTGTVPTSPVQVGWAADGFPILYLYGPDEDGNLKKMTPSYQLKSGNRSGDGVSAPCGEYNGKYTNDFEYVAETGDLDECNGIERSITLSTSSGSETFSYFYVITENFPEIPRCFVGTPAESFR
ncbi:YHYH protein [Reichenbachiella versicolor]|uniref:YHYH protein n=1 Tax=Reichenbachiella versicolor TaxID=1821036 RepID=UPI000D6E4756|nr:YHYH protein [Reichenbachiella versicolor]